MNWFYWAIGSAFFAALTAILAKVGVEGVDSNVATALRTTVVVCFTWAIVTFSGATSNISQLNGRSVLFLVLSGLSTGASWMCYFRALQLGEASQVAPVDKLSVVLVLVFAALFLGENVHWPTILGAALIVGGVMILEPTGSLRNAGTHSSFLDFVGRTSLRVTPSFLRSPIREALLAFLLAWTCRRVPGGE